MVLWMSGNCCDCSGRGNHVIPLKSLLPLLWRWGFLHFWHADAVVIPPTQCFLNEAPDLTSDAAFAVTASQRCLNPSQPLFKLASAVLTAQWEKLPPSQQLSVFTLSSDTFPSVPVSLFSNLLFQSGAYTCVFFSSSHLFYSSINPPQLFPSYCLYSSWQAYVRELVLKSITTTGAIFVSVTRQMSVEIYWSPS